ncbi:hypothetical protein KHS38_21040 [Mucilaginibacter sp. Bleaf8]|uniref:hypothetical protein n=1 Tax=Mucilaginibacter sp. Bleaf8 TaxID=2834430 RepID=UPI001BCCAB53|nr:hypothetical protein [Mucilaginibacter sp. Bleaf8]MBS7566905.1 hypothetical protein [Mucilaginibacter sp. Bleaf8]
METFELTTITDEMQSSITHMAQMRNALIAFTKEVLVKDQDYGVVPGVQKPTLLKPGAEKLMNLFGMAVEFECTDKILDIQSKFIAYTYKATARNKDGRIVTQCEGSVNSYEPKYRYLWMEKPKPNQAMQDLMKAEGTGKFRKAGGSWIWVERTENPDLIGLQNTMQKMAQKRAFVGAMLLATNASEFFTQDVEDMGFIDIEGTVVEEPKTVNKAKEVKGTVQQRESATPAEAKAAAPKAEEAKAPEVKAAPAKVSESKAVKAKAVTKPAEVASSIPAPTRDAIEKATSVAALYLIHKNNVALQQDEQFIKLLSTKKAEIKKGIAA